MAIVSLLYVLITPTRYRTSILTSESVISFLDRTNIGNAKIDGLQEDLKMTNGQYNASLTIFFVSYSVFEPLTNVLLKKLRPSVFLPIIMIWWGICMCCMGLVHNFAGRVYNPGYYPHDMCADFLVLQS